MAKYTRFTNVEVTGDLKANLDGTVGITKATYLIDSTKTLPTGAGDSYTKADITSLLDAVKDLRSKHDALVAALAEGES